MAASCRSLLCRLAYPACLHRVRPAARLQHCEQAQLALSAPTLPPSVQALSQVQSPSDMGTFLQRAPAKVRQLQPKASQGLNSDRSPMPAPAHNAACKLRMHACAPVAHALLAPSHQPLFCAV